jgi:spoIIIJ-associated protein
VPSEEQKSQVNRTENLVQDGQLDREGAAAALRRFLEPVIRAAHWQLSFTIRIAEPSRDPYAVEQAEILVDFSGRDQDVLLERGGEVLKALEHLAFKALRIEPQFHEKLRLDCGGYRALRLEELKLTARVAAERVQSTRQPFRLNPMSPRERRVVHLALKEMPGVRTESLGAGDERQVVIYPADAKKQG